MDPRFASITPKTYLNIDQQSIPRSLGPGGSGGWYAHRPASPVVRAASADVEGQHFTATG